MLSENWHINNTTLLNTEVFELWKRNWLNPKLDDLKGTVKKQKEKDFNIITDVFRDQKSKKIKRMRALNEFRYKGRLTYDDELRPSLDADEQFIHPKDYKSVATGDKPILYVGNQAILKRRITGMKKKQEREATEQTEEDDDDDDDDEDEDEDEDEESVDELNKRANQPRVNILDSTLG